MTTPPQKTDLTAVFGFCGGIITSIIFQPFDVVKMSLMLTANQNKSHRLLNTISNIIKENGFFGLWKGIGISTIRNASGAAVYFYLLRYFQRNNEGMSFLNSAMARIISSIAVNPMSIIQTKVLMPGPKAAKQSSVAYSQMINQKQRFQAMSKGIMASCLKEGLFAGAYYQIFSTLKTVGDTYHAGTNFLNGIIAGLISTAFSHPFQIARAQIQADMNGNIRQVFRQIYNTEGWKGFFKGLSPRLLRKPVINTTTFVLVQQMQFLREKFADKKLSKKE